MNKVNGLKVFLGFKSIIKLIMNFNQVNGIFIKKIIFKKFYGKIKLILKFWIMKKYGKKMSKILILISNNFLYKKNKIVIFY